jgi:predicted HicB family RNase H-like nuclease
MTASKKSQANQFPLRLPRSLKAAAQSMANRDGISLNHFISLAVAEKLERIAQNNPSKSQTKQA